MDLAYPNSLVHAEGTSRRKLTNDDGFKEITDIHGNRIKTSKHLDMYRRWFEKRISETTELVEFIDATEGGAYINGTKIMKLKDILEY